MTWMSQRGLDRLLYVVQLASAKSSNYVFKYESLSKLKYLCNDHTLTTSSREYEWSVAVPSDSHCFQFAHAGC